MLEDSTYVSWFVCVKFYDYRKSVIMNCPIKQNSSILQYFLKSLMFLNAGFFPFFIIF